MDRTRSHTKVLSAARAKLSFVWFSVGFVFFLPAFFRFQKLIQKIREMFSYDH